MTDISVVMSVFNTKESFLRKSIESILCQTFTNFEFIIINYGITDNSLSILKEYECIDNRIKVIHQNNMGLTKSLNNGLKISCGKYIARQDADDYSCVTRLEKQYRFLETNKDLLLLGTDFIVIDDDEKKIVTFRNSQIKFLKDKIQRSNPFVHGSIMFRRLINGKPIFYNEFYKKSQDYDLILNLSEKGNIRILDEVLYHWRFSKAGIAQSGVRFYGERALYNFKMRKADKKEDYTINYSEIMKKPSKGHYEFSLGLKLLAGKKRNATKYFLKAYFMDFFNHRYLLYFLFSLLPSKYIERIRNGKNNIITKVAGIL